MTAAPGQTEGGRATVSLGQADLAGFVLQAKNSDLALYIDQSTSKIAVRDLTSGKLWLSNPPVASTEDISSLWKRRLHSVWVLNYTDPERKRSSTTSSSQQKVQAVYQAIPRGVKVTYRLEDLRIQFSIEFALDGRSFEVRVPDRDVREMSEFPDRMDVPAGAKANLLTIPDTGEEEYRSRFSLGPQSNRIVSLEVLPFFGAAPDTTPGYVLVPDGSGALLYFQRKHKGREDGLSEWIYGPDEHSFEGLSNQRFTLPLFGVVQGNEAFLALVTKGEFDTKLNWAPAGHIVDLNRVAFELVYRRLMTIMVLKGQGSPEYEPSRAKGDRSIRYTFTSAGGAGVKAGAKEGAWAGTGTGGGAGDGAVAAAGAGARAGYADLAGIYRDYLMKEAGLKRLSFASHPPLNLRIFMGVQKKGLFTNPMVVATTFDEAKEIIQAFLDRGVTELEVTLVGWNKGGYGGTSPINLPPEGKLGGASGLRRLVQFAEQSNVKVYLEADYLLSKKGRVPRTHAVRASNNLPAMDEAGEKLLVNARSAFSEYASRDIEAMVRGQYGVSGLDLRHFGEEVLSDYAESNWLRRVDWAGYWQKILDLSRQKLGDVSVEGGNGWALPKVSRLYNVPLGSSNYFASDEEVPFYQMAVHGLIRYMAGPANLRNDPGRDFLRQVEYGALPLFELSYRGSEELAETPYAKLYSGYYKDWLDDAVREYKAVNIAMGRLHTLFMVGHRRLVPDVYEVRYEDGTRVIVNYGAAQYRGEGVSVAGGGYAVVGGF